MVINRNSWHFKYVASMWDERPRTLCGYFWKVMFTIVGFYIAGGVALIGGLFFALFVLTAPITGWFFADVRELAPVTAFIWFGAWVIVQCQYRKYLYNSGKLARAVYIPKEPSLLGQYIEAKHRKVCPLLEYR